MAQRCHLPCAKWIPALCVGVLAVQSLAAPFQPLRAGEVNSLAFKAQPLHHVVSKLGEETGRTLWVSAELADRRVSLFLKKNSAEDARRQLADHFGYMWSKDDTGADLLTQTEERRKLPARLRAERTRAAQALLVRRLNLARKFLRGDAEALSALKRIDLVNGTRLAEARNQNQSQLLQFLDEGDFERLSRDGRWVSRPLETFPPAAQTAAEHWGYDGVRIALDPGQTEPTQAQIDRATAAARRDIARRLLVFQTYGEPDNPAVRGGMVNPLPLTDPGANPNYRKAPDKILLFPATSERIQAPVPLPMLDQPGTDASDPRLQRRISLNYPGQTSAGRDHPARLEDVLEKLAQATGWNVLADSYQSSRGDFLSWNRPLVDVPVWRVLRQINYDFWYECEVREGWLLFRHRRWPFEEAKELPGVELSKLDAEVQEKKGLSVARLQSLAGRLSEPQFRNLPALYPELREQVLPYHTLRLLGALNRQQLNLAASPVGLPFQQFSFKAQAEVRTILISTRPYVGSDQLRDLRLFLVHPQDEAAPTLRLVFAGGDAVEAPLRNFYPITGRRPEELPPWYRRSWEEVAL